MSMGNLGTSMISKVKGERETPREIISSLRAFMRLLSFKSFVIPCFGDRGPIPLIRDDQTSIVGHQALPSPKIES